MFNGWPISEYLTWKTNYVKILACCLFGAAGSRTVQEKIVHVQVVDRLIGEAGSVHRTKVSHASKQMKCF